MRAQQARSDQTRAGNQLPPGPVWRTLPQEFEREIEAWSERRRRRPSARRAFPAQAETNAEPGSPAARDH